MSNQIIIRQYIPSDAQDIASLYYNTIHIINSKHYSEEQINAWAPWSSVEDYSGWSEKLARIKPFVALIDGAIVGFAEFEDNGHIDCFYVHHLYQGQGIGTALMYELVHKAELMEIHHIYAEVSITARLFFESKGFRVVKEQQVNIRGVALTNFIMEKTTIGGNTYSQSRID
jgi:putative acetyltransferase